MKHLTKKTLEKKAKEAAFNFNKISDGNNQVFVYSMVDLFSVSVDEFIAEMHTALSNENLAKICELANRIKPAVQIFQINQVLSLLQEIENATTVDNKLLKQIKLLLKRLKNISFLMRSHIV